MLDKTQSIDKLNAKTRHGLWCDRVLQEEELEERLAPGRISPTFITVENEQGELDKFPVSLSCN